MDFRKNNTSESAALLETETPQIKVIKKEDLRELFREELQIVWPAHLFMPENAIRFGEENGGTSNGASDEETMWNITIPDRCQGVIHSIYLKPNTVFEWIIKINGQPDPEYGSIDWQNLDPNTDGWLMPLGKVRIVLKGGDRVNLYLRSSSASAYAYVVRGYYWPIQNKRR